MSDQHQTVDVQYAVTVDGTPEADAIRQWVLLALPEDKKDSELTLRVVDEAEITALNRQYRGKDGATNVLSFPYEAIPGVATDLLGDIVICAPVVNREAREQGKPERDHWAHLVIHGILHLLGHDHQRPEQAGAMEQLEHEILASLGIADPYVSR